MPRFSISTPLWLTAIVAIAAALPRGYVEIHTAGGVKRFDLPIVDEIAFRAIVVVILILLTLAGYWLFRAKPSPKPLVWAVWFVMLLASIATRLWLAIGDLDP